jgi:Uma2 family endonuclease
MTKATIKFTYEDYKNLPESETKRYELLEGELVMVPSPTFEHQDISVHLEFALYEFVHKHDLGIVLHAPLDVVLDDENVVQPDIIFISKARSQIIYKEAIRGAPDLVIEILSPSTGERDRTIKKKLYARAGVMEYWLVDPESKTIEVLKLSEAGFERVALYKRDEMLTSPVLPGLRIPLKEIFS